MKSNSDGVAGFDSRRGTEQEPPRTQRESGKTGSQPVSCSLIDLRDGPALPTDAVLLALHLESRGHALSVANDKLHVTDGSALTAQDRADITKWRTHLMALVDYCRKGVDAR